MFKWEGLGNRIRENKILSRLNNLREFRNNIFLFKKISRFFRLAKQRITRGFDDSELWNLHYHFAKYIYPRLKAFKEYNRQGYPASMNEKKWNGILDKMIKSFKMCIDEECDESKYLLECNEGLKLFAKYFRGLWD